LINSGIYHILNLPFVLQSTCLHRTFLKFIRFLCSIHSFHFNFSFLWQSIHQPLLKGELFLNFIFLNRWHVWHSTPATFTCWVIEIHKWRQVMNTNPFHRLCFTSIFLIGSIPSTAYITFGFLHHKSFRIFWVAVVVSLTSAILWQFIQTFNEGIPECLLTLEEWQYLQLIPLPAWILCE
jgi:hypothetical protein